MPNPQLLSADPMAADPGSSSLLSADANAADPASAGARFAQGAWDVLNPKNLLTAAVHPVNTLGNLIDAQLEQFIKAKEAYDDGRYSEALGHVGAGALPLVGPPAAHAGERIGSGDVAGGLGEAAGILGGGELAKRAPGAARAVARTGAEVGGDVLAAAPEAAIKAVSLWNPKWGQGLRLLQSLFDQPMPDRPVVPAPAVKWPAQAPVEAATVVPAPAVKWPAQAPAEATPVVPAPAVKWPAQAPVEATPVVPAPSVKWPAQEPAPPPQKIVAPPPIRGANTGGLPVNEAVAKLEAVAPNLTGEESTFAKSLIDNFAKYKTLSPKQAYWVNQLIQRAAEAAPASTIGEFVGKP